MEYPARNFWQFNTRVTISLVVEFKCGNNRYVEDHKRHLRRSKGMVMRERSAYIKIYSHLILNGDKFSYTFKAIIGPHCLASR